MNTILKRHKCDKMNYKASDRIIFHDINSILSYYVLHFHHSFQIYNYIIDYNLQIKGIRITVLLHVN